jgi:hypothetical protein
MRSPKVRLSPSIRNDRLMPRLGTHSHATRTTPPSATVPMACVNHTNSAAAMAAGIRPAAVAAGEAL